MWRRHEYLNLNHAGRLALFFSLLLTTLAVILHAEDQFFDSAGVRIHCTAEGKGEPVILIHPFGLTIAVTPDLIGMI
jgi:hypothetical protein